MSRIALVLIEQMVKNGQLDADDIGEMCSISLTLTNLCKPSDACRGYAIRATVGLLYMFNSRY